MRILLTGANGYVGKRLLPILIQEGHEVYCVVRDKERLNIHDSNLNKVKIVEADFLKKETLSDLPKEFDVAYYLIHSMSGGSEDFAQLEKQAASNFKDYINQTQAQQIIYLGGISNDKDLSKHLKSRNKVEAILSESKVPVTIIRAAIIIGSGGASFEIIRDLVEKLPIMIAPKWLNTKCQPIAIRNVIQYLCQTLLKEESYDKTFDIGGPDILTYKQMLLQFAELRNFKRYILTLPVLSPKISSYWLYFVTSTSFQLAMNLVDSMKNEVIVENDLNKLIPIELISYKEAVSLAFKKIDQNMVVSSWVDSDFLNESNHRLNDFIEVPKDGIFKDEQSLNFKISEQERILNNVWSIGGERGWYYGNYLWRIRGFMDKLIGGVGLRRGRRSPTDIYAGDSLDFWRVLLADKKNKRLLLYAEMKLPGEAWLEFKITNGDNVDEKRLTQTATFRPNGVAGRLYWCVMLPFHFFIFKNMLNRIVNNSN